MRELFTSRGGSRRAVGLVAIGAIAVGCQDQTLAAILPAPDAVLVDTNDAALDVESGKGDADGGSDGAGGLGGDSGGVVSKIASLAVHDTDADRVALWSVQHDFEIGMNGVYPWGDWPKTYFVSMDPGAMVMLGKDYIAVASESKKYTAGPQVTVTFNAPADLYMIFDDRWLTPPWIAGWTDTGWNMIVWESVNRPSLAFSVLTRSVPAGPLDLPPIGDTTGYNYVVVVN